MSPRIADETMIALGKAAWTARERARILGHTAVGCAAIDERGTIAFGCNVEHKFRSHDIHAEISALSSLVASGGRRLKAVFIAAERDRFTPCGACLDWIFELGGDECIVAVQRERTRSPDVYLARDLMPYYPQ